MKSSHRNSITLLSLLLITLFFVSCSKDKDQDNTPIDTTASFKGSFVSWAHPTSGKVTVNKDKTVMSFTDFESHSGPDLDIYLASDVDHITSEFISLGDIKGLSGNFTYDLPPHIDFAKFKYVVVWCVDFDVNFGYATLAP